MERYDRHHKLIGENEFKKIQSAKIAVVGSGGLGSTVLQLLARIGFGEIHHWDYAILDLPDLNRQILYDTKDLGKKKATIAKEKLEKINPNIKIFSYDEKLEETSKIPEVDLVIDCLDNFKSRLVLDKLFFEKGVAIIHAGVFRYIGQVTAFIPGKTRNYADTFGIERDPKEVTIKEVFPSIVTTLASLQVNEAVKYVTKRFDKMLINKLLVVDLFNNSFDTIELEQ